MPEDTIDPTENYLLLDTDGKAVPLPGGEEFWHQLMSGKTEDAGVKRVLASEHGRLLTVMPMNDDWTSWEMHPSGDEILFLLSGEMTIVFEEGTSERLVTLTAGRLAIVPKGVWHTARMDQPCVLLTITDGAGTQHRGA